MSEVPYIPQRTLDMLIAEHPEGTRHSAKLKIAMPLLGNGFSPAAVIVELRSKFPNAPDKEIEGVVNWCAAKNPTPSGYGTPARTTALPTRPGVQQALPPPSKPVSPEKAAAELVGSDVMGEAYWRDRSPIALSEDFRQDAALLLAHLYSPHETVNIVTKYTVNDKGKANPSGAGKTLTRDEWIEYFRAPGVPFSDAGAWIRPNPSALKGSGHDGAVTDADTMAHRFLMVESDRLPLDVQFTLYSKLPLPIAAIILSGGDSAHAWLKVDCKDADEYRQLAKEFFDLAESLGFDPANKNSSRLSRLPGVPRKIGANKDGQQRLIYLNPTPDRYNFSRLKASAVAAPELIRADALVHRFREHMKPKRRAFTLDFLRGIDDDHGFYFRQGEVTIWSGMSGHGKSTMLSTVMLRLMAENIPFFVCSLEYKPEKLVEMMARIMYRRPITADEGADFLTCMGHLFSFSDVVGEIPPAKLVQLMRSANARYGASHFFIDSLMRVGGLEEDYPAQGQFLNTLQAVAKETDGHIHLVAHPRKIDEASRARKMDVKGSSGILNNADNMVTMRRNTAKRDLMEKGPLTDEQDAGMHDAEFAIEKQRATGWEHVIKLKFNRISKTFEAFVEPKKEFLEDPHAKRRRD